MIGKFNASEQQQHLSESLSCFLEERKDTAVRSKGVERIDLEGLPDCFLLRKILSPEECQKITEGAVHQENIETFNETGVYRRVMRIQVMQDDFADWLYKVIKPYLPETYKVEKDEKEFGRLAEGVWEVDSLNPNLRFCKYDSSGFFKPHFDGTYLKSEDSRTFFTILLYLSQEMKGGETNFLHRELWNEHNQRKVLASIKPECGTALIFPQNVIHEGAELEGIKHFMRTDIFYTRVIEEDEGMDAETRLAMMETKEKAQCYLDLAREYERCHQPMKAVEYYRKAFKLNPALDEIVM